MLLLDDAVAFFGTYAWERDRAIPYLKAAEAAAASLLASHAALPGLVERVLALAECVVQASEHGYGEREDALQRGIALLDLLLAALPSTPRRLEIAQTKEGWRRELHPPEPSQDPVRPAGGAPRDPAIEKAQEICRSLLTRRLDTALLAELASISQGMTDRSYQGRCLAICYLGYRLAGRQAEAQQALLQMGQIPGATPLELASLLRPCNNCNGRAQIFASCAACSGRGRQSCTQCGGRGQLPRRFGGTPSICPVCSGQGYSSCPICSATGRIAQPCRACGGRGQQGSNEEMGRLYGTYLTGAAP